MMSQCFWCDGTKNEILIGKMQVPDMDKVPRSTVIDYDMCDECKENTKDGVRLIEFADTPWHAKQKPIQRDIYPSGRWLCVVPDALDRWMDPKTASAAKSAGSLLVDQEFMSGLLKEMEALKVSEANENSVTESGNNIKT